MGSWELVDTKFCAEKIVPLIPFGQNCCICYSTSRIFRPLEFTVKTFWMIFNHCFEANLSSSLRTFELFWWWKKVPQSIIPLRLCFLEKCLVEKYLFWQRRWLLQSQHFDTLDRWVLQENVGRSKRSMLPLYLCRLFLCVQGRKNCFKKVVTSTLALKPPQNNFEFYYALWVKI